MSGLPAARAERTLTIDDESDPGSWATSIAHTPHLAAQIDDEGDIPPAQDSNVND